MTQEPAGPNKTQADPAGSDRPPRAPLGQPRLGPRARTLRLELRLSPSEVALIDAARLNTDLGRSSYVRKAALHIARLAVRSQRMDGVKGNK